MARGGRGRRISVLLLEAGQVCLKYFPIFLWFEVYGGSCVSPACYRADNFIFSCCAARLFSAGCYNMMQIQLLLTCEDFEDFVERLLSITKLNLFNSVRSIVFVILKVETSSNKFRAV